MTEWRVVAGFDGRYEVSDGGQVRSYAVWRGRPGPRILKPQAATNRRLQVTLYQGSTRSIHYVHRLVLGAFVGPCPDGLETRHLDDDPDNNALSNIVYGTRSENLLDRVRLGTDHNVRKTHCPANHPYDESNTYISPKGGRACRICSRECGRKWAAHRRSELRKSA